VNGTAKKSQDSPAEVPGSDSRQTNNRTIDSARAKTPAAETTSAKDSTTAPLRSSDSSTSVKEEKKKDSQELQDIPMEVDKRTDAEAEAKKAAAEAERRRIREKKEEKGKKGT
jgi:flagellar motor switch/type III secretory pathway protein FliN